MTQDSAGFWACFYFIAVLIAMQWVVLNIAVAVIADSYDSVMEEIEQKEKEKRIAQRKMLAEKARLAKLKKEKAKAAGKHLSTESLATTEDEPPKKGLAKIKDMLVLKPLTPEQAEKRAPITRLVKSRPFTWATHTSNLDAGRLGPETLCAHFAFSCPRLCAGTCSGPSS